MVVVDVPVVDVVEGPVVDEDGRALKSTSSLSSGEPSHGAGG